MTQVTDGTEYREEDLKSLLCLYDRIAEACIERNLCISFMESCTGGFLSAMLTNTEGVSAVFREGDITYCNEAKIREGVDADVLDLYGVYSMQTAISMAKAAQKNGKAEIGIGVTGCFGRVDPANPLGVPGEVFYAIVFHDRITEGYTELKPGRSRFADKIETARVIGEDLLHQIENSGIPVSKQ